MPTLPKYRKMKRPKVVAKKNLKRRSFDKKSNALIYENLKINNKALARALTQQKEETHQLTLENLALTRELQESRYLKKRHIEAFGVILKNSREAMNLMVKATEKVVCAITTCNTFIQPEGQNASRPSVSKDRRSAGKSPNKSPARGVVQPMVSGHAIAQPAIALSRIRIAMPPSVSDIDEGSENSPGTPGTRRPQRNPANRTTRPVNRTTPLLPQRIRVSSPRDESLEDRRHSNISSRRSSRYQKRKSRSSARHSGDHEPLLPPRNSINPIDTTIRSPRVSLEDVSRLMHNSQSINVRNLMDTSTEEPSNATQSTEEPSNSTQSTEEPPNSTQSTEEPSNTTQDTSESAPASPTNIFVRPSNIFVRPTTPAARVSSVSPLAESVTSSPLSRTSSPTYQYDHRMRKIRKRRLAEKAKAEGTPKKRAFDREDDPLEGPSWRFPDSPVDEDVNETNKTNNTTHHESMEHSGASSQMFNGSLRDSVGLPPTARLSLSMRNANGWAGSESDDDDEVCRKIDVTAGNPDEETGNFTAIFARNVCTSRGRTADLDPDEFTMTIRPNPRPQPLNFDALVMPEILPQVLEAPLMAPAESMIEPEITKTIQIMAGLNQQVNQMLGGEGLPNVTINTSVTMPVIDTAGRESEDDTTILVGRRNRVVVPIIESSSESESSSPPKRSAKGRSRVKGSKRRDPSSAKVVLEKLKEPEKKKRAGSPDPRRSTLNGYAHRTSASLTSDSESSNASFGSNSRPRRNKAPTNFAEPSLRKKLRRN